jgi:hypothetical protein
MSGMEFTWRLIAVLAWPMVVLSLLVVYRGWITSTVSSVTAGKRLEEAGIGPFRFKWAPEIDTAGREVAGALAQMPEPPNEGPVPTSLVDLIGDINQNPRYGIRKAFNLVRRALDEFYPELTPVASPQLSRAIQDLVRRGRLSAEVERAISQLYQLLEMSETSNGMADQTQGYEFLMLAEGAIHAILRSARIQASSGDNNSRIGSDSTPIRPSWRGRYNNDYPIELHIERWSPGEFAGKMIYPDSGTVTRVLGRIETKSRDRARDTITWEETDYTSRGNRRIDFNGRYQATVADDTITGAWYQGDRRVAEFQMKAAGVGTVPALST